MSSSVDRFDDEARRKFSKVGKTTVHRGELLRHPVYTRVLHWTVAISFASFGRTSTRSNTVRPVLRSR